MRCEKSSVLGYLWLRLTIRQGNWPEQVALLATVAPPPLVDDGSARITLIGRTTLRIQVAGLNILTDPIWSERASFVQWLGPKRVSPPSVRLQALPPIHVVLISHNHYDQRGAMRHKKHHSTVTLFAKFRGLCGRITSLREVNDIQTEAPGAPAALSLRNTKSVPVIRR